MSLLSQRQQLLVAALLAVLMVMTRGHHFADINVLPSASWAVFMLAGFYLASKLWFPAFLGLAVALDLIAVTWGGVSNFCVSPAYGFLLPAYGSLWLAGRWFSSRYQFNWTALFTLVITVLTITAVASVFSGGGFYWFSGRYVEPTFVEYLSRFIQSYPNQLSRLSFYIAIAAVVHISFRFAHVNPRSNQTQ
ncbi:Optional hypothetical component of the B12 transporter BtuM [Methylophaga lonarensis MPL]|uniref:Optional hypothetical component of the B12 transporter BtuM n=1 Tax=Methylophaga lonarensis MPL TaxID=1286106 RepID=M7PU20_9GAMM|nr:hypothetical protein [Methylophaga lonarensis]EMR13964.1 Optional hypothetical component of the B12 transporter BtuM [Methylophaga lonarensis MPL]